MGSQEGAGGGLGDVGWWQGKVLLGTMSLLLQKVPIMAVTQLFRIERNRRRAEAMHLKPYKACRLCKIPRAFTVIPWLAFFLLLVVCFGITIVLTSTGFLQTGAEGGGGNGPGEEDTTHCGCAGVSAGKDVESDWITLLLLIVGFRTLVYRPLMIATGTVLFVCAERRNRTSKNVHTREESSATGEHKTAAIEMSSRMAAVLGKHGGEKKKNDIDDRAGGAEGAGTVATTRGQNSTETNNPYVPSVGATSVWGVGSGRRYGCVCVCVRVCVCVCVCVTGVGVWLHCECEQQCA